MAKHLKYLFLSAPSSITPSGHKEDAIQSLQQAVTERLGTVTAFSIPEFKVGTLDGLIQQSEELAKLEALCQGVVLKTGDALKSILGGDEEKMRQHTSVNDSTWAGRALDITGTKTKEESGTDVTCSQNR